MDSVTFMLSEMSLEVSPVCLQLQQLVTFDVLSRDVKFCGANVWRNLEVVKEVKVHAFWTFVMCWVTFILAVTRSYWTSWCSVHHLGKCWVQIVVRTVAIPTEVLRGLRHFFHVNARMASQITPRPVLCTCIPMHNLLISRLFDAFYSLTDSVFR